MTSVYHSELGYIPCVPNNTFDNNNNPEFKASVPMIDRSVVPPIESSMDVIISVEDVEAIRADKTAKYELEMIYWNDLYSFVYTAAHPETSMRKQ